MDGNERDRIERHLTAARDELIAYWEQPDGQTCMLALRFAEDALMDYQAFREREAQGCATADTRRIAAIADAVTRLRAPLKETH